MGLSEGDPDLKIAYTKPIFFLIIKPSSFLLGFISAMKTTAPRGGRFILQAYLK